ncbi:MAG: DUF3460 family protein [Pigmentiphaga sp.]
MATSYESEITVFLKTLKKKNPRLEASQREGRSRLWDKQIDPELVEGFQAASVKQKPYVYQTED